MTQVITGKCSHCSVEGKHTLEARWHLLARNHYRCKACGLETVRCRLCENMARVDGSWAEELCAEHWQTDFWLDGQLECVSNWAELWNDRRPWFQRALSSLDPFRTGLVESFCFHKLHSGSGEGPKVIYVNGLLGQGVDSFDDWSASGESLFRGYTAYGLRWESLRSEVWTGISAVRTGGLGIWHYTKSKAEDAGRMLAGVLARTPGQEFILCGHSLGARVIATALQELSRADRLNIVKTAHLMGGAVGVSERRWRAAVSSCRGGIANYYSLNDDVLRYPYRFAMAFASEPIGLAPITIPMIRNVDVTNLVGGHAEYKSEFRNFASFPRGLDIGS